MYIFFQYFTISYICFIILWFAYIKILYPFWNIQPVLHPYDIWRYIYLQSGGKPFIIYGQNNFINDKFIAPFDIMTYTHETITDTVQQEIVHLLQRKYIDSPDIVFTIDTHIFDNIVKISHNQPSYISCHKNACCVSYSITLYQSTEKILAYMIDLFTVDSFKPELLFQTHEYNQRMANPLHGGNISFFRKKKHPYLGISPSFSSDIHIFPIQLHEPVQKFPTTFELCRVFKNNYSHYIIDFFKSLPCHCIAVDISTILHWINVQYWYVFILIQKQQLIAIYFFRNTLFQYEEFSTLDMNSKSVELIGSFNNTKHDTLFFDGFLHCIKEITTKINLDYRILQIIHVSNGNDILLRRFSLHHSIICKYPIYYYFFNYCWIIQPQRFLLLA